MSDLSDLEEIPIGQSVFESDARGKSPRARAAMAGLLHRAVRNSARKSKGGHSKPQPVHVRKFSWEADA